MTQRLAWEGLTWESLWGLLPGEELADPGSRSRPTGAPGIGRGSPLPSFRPPGVAVYNTGPYCPLLVVGGMDTTTRGQSLGGLRLGAPSLLVQEP